MPSRTLKAAIEHGDTLLVGTREKVIYLARNCATPAVAKLVKDGWWTVGRIFYGYFEHRQFTALTVPKAVGFKDSHECHMFAGLGGDADEARLNGPLTVAAFPCACVHCTAGHFDSCQMRSTLFCNQRLRRVKTPREQNSLSGLRQLESLHVFAAACKKGQLCASRVSSDEVCLEGMYYLMKLKCAPYTLDADTVFATDTFEQGDLVVKANYFKFERYADGGFRVYSIMDQKGLERMIQSYELTD